MRKLICYIENGGTIAFEGPEADTIYDILNDYADEGELDDPDTSLMIGEQMSIEKAARKVSIKL